jgi:hypothetical protein
MAYVVLFLAQIPSGVPVCEHEVGGEGRDHRLSHELMTTVSSFRDKYAVEFQFVDMRWGVRDENTDDHMNS